MADMEKNTQTTEMTVKETSGIAECAPEVSGMHPDNDYSNFQGIDVNTSPRYNRFGKHTKKKKKKTEIPEIDPETMKRRTNVTLIVVGLLIVLFIFYAFSAYRKDASITKSTHSRSALKTDSVEFVENDTMYNEGTVDYAGEYLSYVEEALETFYSQTGVQPYLYIVSSEEASDDQSSFDTFARGLYNEGNIIKDEAHLLVVYQDNNPDAQIGAAEVDYYVSVIVGEDAASVIDDEAVNIFLDYLNKYYYGTDYDANTLFYGTFTSASSRIMGGSTLFTTIVLVIVVALLIIVFVFRYRILSSKYDNPGPDEPDTRTPEEIAKAERRERWLQRFFG